MRNLIRLLLLIFVRTSLFLALVAWIAGQWWIFTEHVAVAGYGGGVQVVRPGIALWTDPGIQSWGFRVKQATESDLHNSIYGQLPRLALNTSTGGSVNSQLPGVVMMQVTIPPGVSVAVTIRHWVLASFFIALNATLWLIYRKRPEVQPCKG